MGQLRGWGPCGKGYGREQVVLKVSSHWSFLAKLFLGMWHHWKAWEGRRPLARKPYPWCIGSDWDHLHEVDFHRWRGLDRMHPQALGRLAHGIMRPPWTIYEGSWWSRRFLQTVRKPAPLFKGRRENPRHDSCISLTLASGMEMEHLTLETIPRSRKCLGAVSMDLQRKKISGQPDSPLQWGDWQGGCRGCCLACP